MCTGVGDNRVQYGELMMAADIAEQSFVSSLHFGQGRYLFLACGDIEMDWWAELLGNWRVSDDQSVKYSSGKLMSTYPLVGSLPWRCSRYT